MRRLTLLVCGLVLMAVACSDQQQPHTTQSTTTKHVPEEPLSATPGSPETFNGSETYIQFHFTDAPEINVAIPEIAAPDFFSSDSAPTHIPSERLSRLVGGSKQIPVIESATKATAQKIRWPNSDPEKQVLVGDPIVLSQDHMRRLSKLLLSDSSYLWDATKFCGFDPALLVVFEKDDERIEVYICHKCMQLVFRPGRGQDFDPIAGELRKWQNDVFRKAEHRQSATD